MLFRMPKRKEFDYTPQYYKPESDPEAKRRQRIHFPRSGRSQTSIYRWLLPLILLLALIAWLLKKLEIYF